MMISLDQAADPGFAFGEIVVKSGILQRDRRLRGKQLQHGGPGGHEDPGSQVVFEIEHADELGSA